MDINAIRTRLMELFPGVHTYTTLEGATTPFAVVGFPQITPQDQTYGGSSQVLVTVTLGTSQQSQKVAEEWLGDQVSNATINQVSGPWRGITLASSGKPYTIDQGNGNTVRCVDLTITLFA